MPWLHFPHACWGWIHDIQRGLRTSPRFRAGRTHSKRPGHHHPGGLCPHTRCTGAVLLALRASTSGKILTVFGCGAIEIPANDPKWVALHPSVSDHVYVTSDNPRSEDRLHHRRHRPEECGLVHDRSRSQIGNPGPSARPRGRHRPHCGQRARNHPNHRVGPFISMIEKWRAAPWRSPHDLYCRKNWLKDVVADSWPEEHLEGCALTRGPSKPATGFWPFVEIRFDAHDFIEQAIEAGATGVIAEHTRPGWSAGHSSGSGLTGTAEPRPFCSFQIRWSCCGHYWQCRKNHNARAWSAWFWRIWVRSIKRRATSTTMLDSH